MQKVDSDVIDRPEAIRLEASSACQLRCPTCPTTTGETHRFIGKGYLHSEDFVRLLDGGGGSIRFVELSNYGEIFLNPHLLKIMEIAAARGVALSCHSGANLNNVREEVLEAIVRYGMEDITCSIDGASEETYPIYRRRGSFSTVIDNIKKINFYKKKYGASKPRLLWQFVVFGHNEHEIDAARAMAAELDMAFFVKLSWDGGFSPIKDRQAVIEKIGGKAVDSEDFEQETNTAYMASICDQLWVSPQINYDGRVLGCCTNYWADFGGNAFQDYDDAINSERLQYARAMLSGRADDREDIPCTRCNIYRARKESRDWVSRA